MAEFSAKHYAVEGRRNATEQHSRLIGNHTAHIVDVATGKQALEALALQSVRLCCIDPDVA
jgi:hypothetical protein